MNAGEHQGARGWGWLYKGDMGMWIEQETDVVVQVEERTGHGISS